MKKLLTTLILSLSLVGCDSTEPTTPSEPQNDNNIEQNNENQNELEETPNDQLEETSTSTIHTNVSNETNSDDKEETTEESSTENVTEETTNEEKEEKVEDTTEEVVIENNETTEEVKDETTEKEVVEDATLTVYSLESDGSYDLIELESFENLYIGTNSIEENLTAILEKLETVYFRDEITLTIVSIEDGLATINISTEEDFFQFTHGSTGGLITQQTLVETVLQRKLDREWVTEVKFLVDNKEFELDHINLLDSFK